MLQVDENSLPSLLSCWVHINGRPRLKAEPEGEKAEDYVRDLLGVKEGLRPYCVIAIGYPEENQTNFLTFVVLSTKRALFVDKLVKNVWLSIKTTLSVDR